MGLDRRQDVLTYRAALTATIASGQSLSGEIELSGNDVLAIQLPSSWTAAALTFQASADGLTFGDVKDKDGEISFASDKATAGAYLVLDPIWFAGARKLKVRSGTSATPVNQSASRSILVSTRPV